MFKPKPARTGRCQRTTQQAQRYGTEPNTYTYPDVGAEVIATDPNDDTLTYSLGGTDAGSFDIVQADGQIKVKTKATKLNK